LGFRVLGLDLEVNCWVDFLLGGASRVWGLGYWV
jgi:hypothetical protein